MSNMRKDPRRSVASGFSLVELMIVVVILSILAAVAVVGYRKYIARARSTEAFVILSEMNSREQTYRLEFAMYLPLRRSMTSPFPVEDSATSYPNTESIGEFYPSDPTASGFESSRTPVSIADPTAWPPTWRALGLRPRERQLYCTYLTNAGNALRTGGDVLAAGSYGIRAFGGLTTMTSPWYYSMASCNLAGGNATIDETSVFVNSSLSPTIGNFNENK